MKKQRVIITIILSFLLISLIACQLLIIFKSNKETDNYIDLEQYLTTSKETMSIGKTKQLIKSKSNYSYAINYPHLDNKKINEQINTILEREINNLKKKVNIDQSNDTLIINYEIYEYDNTISFIILKKYLSDNVLNINTYIFETDTGMIINNIFVNDKQQEFKEKYDFNTNYIALNNTQVLFYSIVDNNLQKEELEINEIKDYLEIKIEQENIDESNKRKIDSEKPMVALTFDDGPHPKNTPPIIETLKEYNSVATFFEVGYMLKNYSYVSLSAKEIGCEIGSHTYNHINLKKSSKQERIDELKKMDELFYSIFNEYPKLLRPPYGAYDNELTNVTEEALILWSIDTNDWKVRNKDKIINHIKEQGNLDGQVILMHSIYKETADAVAELVPWLIEEGYQLVTVTELIENKYNTNTENEKIFGYYYFG